MNLFELHVLGKGNHCSKNLLFLPIGNKWEDYFSISGWKNRNWNVITFTLASVQRLISFKPQSWVIKACALLRRWLRRDCTTWWLDDIIVHQLSIIGTQALDWLNLTFFLHMPIFPHPTPSYSPTENDHCSVGGPRAGWAVCTKVTEGGV